MAYYPITLMPAFYILYLAATTHTVTSDIYQTITIFLILELVRWFFQGGVVNEFAPEHTSNPMPSTIRYGERRQSDTKRYLPVLGLFLTLFLWFWLTDVFTDFSFTTITTASVFTIYLSSIIYWALKSLANTNQIDLYYINHTNGVRIFLFIVTALSLVLVLLNFLELDTVASYTVMTLFGFLIINDLFLAYLVKKLRDSEKVHTLYRKVAIRTVMAFIISLPLLLFI